MNASFHRITEVLQQRLDERGYQVLLCVTDSDPARERRYLDMLLDHRVDGLIIVGTGDNTATVREVSAAGIPVVNLMRTPDGAPGDSVMAADRDGAELAVRHLLDLGHRNIAFIGGPPGVDSGRDRYGGIRRGPGHRRTRTSTPPSARAVRSPCRSARRRPCG
ncbi:substrate-binding domain-containing protein [Streptomyces sp. L7]